jgi:hypothetical protein
MTSLTKLLIYFLLILIIVASFLYYGIQKPAFILSSCSIGLISILTIYKSISKLKKGKQYRRLYEEYAYISATILGAEKYKNNLILQLQIHDTAEDYISGLRSLIVK